MKITIVSLLAVSIWFGHSLPHTYSIASLRELGFLFPASSSCCLVNFFEVPLSSGHCRARHLQGLSLFSTSSPLHFPAFQAPLASYSFLSQGSYSLPFSYTLTLWIPVPSCLSTFSPFFNSSSSKERAQNRSSL